MSMKAGELSLETGSCSIGNVASALSVANVGRGGVRSMLMLGRLLPRDCSGVDCDSVSDTEPVVLDAS